MAAVKPIVFDVQRLIDEVAARHRLLLKPDDAAFAIVTMNRLVLEESLEAIHSQIVEDLALFEAAAKKAQTRAGTILAAEVRESAAGIRQELERDVQDARLQASKIVREVEAAYQQRMSAQQLAIAALAAVLLFFAGYGRDGSARCGGRFKQRR
jgi:type VI protein secretion system component VasF